MLLLFCSTCFAQVISWSMNLPILLNRYLYLEIMRMGEFSIITSKFALIIKYAGSDAQSK